MSGPYGGGGERGLSLTYKICKKNKEDWTSVEKEIIFLENVYSYSKQMIAPFLETYMAKDVAP